MMTIDEMRGIARFIKKELPDVRGVRFGVHVDRLELEVTMQSGRVFYDALDIGAIESSWLLDQVMKAFCDGVHDFVRQQKQLAA